MGRSNRRRGFTLLELLVVLTIVLAISAVALPTVRSALANRQGSEAARLVQGSLVGARDSAIHNNAPSGIRLLPDPAFPIVRLANGQIDPNQALCANRIIPIEPAPQYTEGLVAPATTAADLGAFVPPFPCLVLVESAVNATTGLPNSPTSWFWNIRVGDKIQINKAGPWYTVVGPMVTTPAAGNSEMFVNIGAPNTPSPLPQNQGPIGAQSAVLPEFLYLVNGQADTYFAFDPTIMAYVAKQNLWPDSGYDGVDNDGDGLIDETTCALNVAHGEWEIETWLGSVINGTHFDLPYTVIRRPVPSSNSREVALPSNVVIDLTTWGTTKERSRVPVNVWTGYVDLLSYPDGTVAPPTVYSTRSSFGMSNNQFFLWLAERADVSSPSTTVVVPPFLPPGDIVQSVITGVDASGSPIYRTLAAYAGTTTKGRYSLIGITARTGQINSDPTPMFDNPTDPGYNGKYNPSRPYAYLMQGGR